MMRSDHRSPGSVNAKVKMPNSAKVKIPSYELLVTSQIKRRYSSFWRAGRVFSTVATVVRWAHSPGCVRG